MKHTQGVYRIGMVDVHGMKLADVARLIRSRQHSAVEFTEAYLGRIEKYNARLNAYLKVFADEALAEAAKADKEIEAGTVRGPLHGVPIALKDIIDIAGHVTTAGGILLPDAPAEEDAEVTRRLRSAGAVLIGKLNLHEYAWGGTTDNPHYGRCYNPWKEGYSPGGSSGGSGAAVAADLCAAALGTDTLGSIRIPSSYCGTVGFKPTYGLVSTRGVYPLSWALDSVGPLARSVEDAAIVLGVLAGPDPREPTSAMREAGDLLPESRPSLRGIRLGVIEGYSLEGGDSPRQKAVTDAVAEALEHLISLGAERVDLDLPEIRLALRAAFDITLSDAAALHAQHMEDSPDSIGADVRRLLQSGAAMSPARVAEAHRQRAVLRHRFAEVMREVDCLISPTTPVPAHSFEGGGGGSATFTGPINLLGYPAISVPCGFTADGLPIGLQIATGEFEEKKAAAIAQAYEVSTPWSDRRPEGFD